MTEIVSALCREYSYPDGAEEALVSGMSRILDCPEAREIFTRWLELYESDRLPEHRPALQAMDEVATLSGVHEYTVKLLLYICMAPHLHELYLQRGLPETVYRDTVCDLKWKLLECRDVYGIWGSFVTFWFQRFYDCTRFTLGRLQFESIEFEHEYQKNGITVEKGTTVINVHIPSGSPLRDEDCMESFRQAHAFYRDIFQGGPSVFVCESWLLYPPHRDFLPAASRIRMFMDYFEIFESHEDAAYSDMWRIFNKEWDGNIDALPEDTSLRRAYKERLRSGGKVGNGTGIFLFDGQKIIR